METLEIFIAALIDDVIFKLSIIKSKVLIIELNKIYFKC